MEDTLRVNVVPQENYVRVVLILVLMEDTLRVYNYGKEECYRGLNPCFNGRYSQRAKPKNP